MSSRGPSLFVAYSGKSGGAGRFLADVVAGWPRPAVVACPPGELEASCRARGVPVLQLRDRPLALRGGARTGAGAAAALAGHAREIRRLVDALDPELLVTWGMRSALAAARVRRRPPWIARHHDFLPGAAVATAVRRALRRADAVVVNSRAVADDLRLGRPVEVILPGVDLELFTPPPAAPRHDTPVALWLGAIVGWKRPELAVAVAARAPDVAVRIAGKPLDEDGGRLLAELRSTAGAGVEFCGQVDAAAALRSADVLLHTADREPFGIAVAEALACGVPVVAPAAGGPAEMVDETCGRLFPPGDADGAASAVGEVLADRPRLSAGARARAEERLDLERARAQLHDVAARHAGEPPASGSGADLALVTVSHDSAPELDALLASVERHLPGAQVVVVDSGSKDESAAVARSHGAQVLELENVGYGSAANAGVEAVTRPVSVVLNPDVELVDGSLAALAADLARADRGERIAVPTVLLPDGSRQDVAQHEPGSLATVPRALLPAGALPRPLRVALEPWRARRPRRAGWPVGACLAARTETLRALGPFDPEIFLYAEDVDLGLRAADAGVETWFWPDARVLHRRAHSTTRTFGGEPFDLLARQRRGVLERRRGRRRARADELIQVATLTNRIALKTLVRRDTERERRQLRALRAARRER